MQRYIQFFEYANFPIFIFEKRFVFNYILDMKVILKTYKYRMYPNKEQEQMLARYFGAVRFVYAGKSESHKF